MRERKGKKERVCVCGTDCSPILLEWGMAKLVPVCVCVCVCVRERDSACVRACVWHR